MQAQTTPSRPEGKPATPAVALSSRVLGMVRLSIDLLPAMVGAVEALAHANPTGAVPRAVMTRTLLGEALAARGVDWTESAAKQGAAKKKKGARK